MPYDESSGSKRTRFKEAYDACYSAILTTLNSKVGNFDDAQDLAQEIFARLYKKIEDVESPRTWLYGTMKNVLLDHYKGKGRTQEDIDTMLDDVSMGYVNGFRDTRIVIGDVLKDPNVYQSDLNRAVFDLVAVHGFTLAETARHCDISYRQVRYAYTTTTQRVLNALRSKGIAKIEDLL
jgi:RNA polymerase sigma factor (sigma-70 family)